MEVCVVCLSANAEGKISVRSNLNLPTYLPAMKPQYS